MSPFHCPSSPSPLKAFTPCKGIQFAESGKFWLVESGILGIVIQNTAQEIRNSHLSLESRIQVSLTKTGIQCAESGIQGVKSRIQDCLGFSYMRRKIAHTRYMLPIRYFASPR